MKKFCCLILAIFIEFCCVSCNFCDASSKKDKVRSSSSRKIKKNKKKPEYRQKKELDMFVNFLISEKYNLEEPSED